MSAKKRRSSDDREGTEKEKHREKVAKRARQWQTVGSDDDSDDDQGSEAGSNNSTDSSDSDSASDSDENSRKQSKRDEKKLKKDKKKKHKSVKKHKKDKKEKKSKHRKHHKDEKKSKKKEKRENKEPSVAINQNEYGKYGIIRDENFFSKQREFEVYMEEVKGMPGIMVESKRDIMLHFKSFIEDYNTATMPHDKFYNYEAWEMAEYERKKRNDHLKAMQDAEDDDFVPAFASSAVHDEQNHKLKLKREKEALEMREFNKLKMQMNADADLKKDMRRQESMTNEMQQAFKRGDHQTLKKLEKKLAPEEMKVAVKHPWAG